MDRKTRTFDRLGSSSRVQAQATIQRSDDGRARRIEDLEDEVATAALVHRIDQTDFSRMAAANARARLAAARSGSLPAAGR